MTALFLPDTTRARAADSVAMAAYIHQLEHTSAFHASIALALSYFVAALGVLFTAGAIVAAILIWRESKESRDRIAQYMAAAKAQVDVALSQVNAAIMERQGRLDSTGGVANEEIRSDLAALRELRATLATSTMPVPSSSDPNEPHLRTERGFLRCANCRQTSEAAKAVTASRGDGQEVMRCPRCGEWRTLQR